jgi:cytochrome c oxidase subunit 1
VTKAGLLRREEGVHNYLTEGTTVRSWLVTTDHKRIAILYAASITLFFFG